jgi:hypothetical protein
VGTIVGGFLALLLLLDLVLPHHYTESEITHYITDVGMSPTGISMGMIQTIDDDKYFLSKMQYSLYNKHRYILIERSWIFHNPIRIISKGKIDRNHYEIHLSAYSLTWFLALVFLLPTLTMLFKRKHIFYTMLYHASYFGTSAVIFFYLLTGQRLIHVLTLGFF